MIKTGFFIAAFILYLNCLGQPLRFNKITSQEGLSQSEVYSFLKDKHGFMWIGTLDGLNRYDGYRITKFNINNTDSNSLSNGTIRALAEDGSGRIWIGTDNGLNVFFHNKQRIFRVKLPLSNSFPTIQTLLADSNFLWIGTKKGLFKADIKIDDFALLEKNIQRVTELNDTQIPENVFRYSSTPSSISNNYIRTIYRQDKNTFWIGTYNGLNKFERQNGSDSLKITAFYQSDGLPNKMIQSISEDDNNNLWIGTNYGLSKFSTSSPIINNYDFSDRLQNNEFSEQAVFKANNGELFFGGINGVTAFFPNGIKDSSIQPNITLTDFYLFNEKVEVQSRNNRRGLLENPISLTNKLNLKPKKI